jgi:hypothetical protein
MGEMNWIKTGRYACAPAPVAAPPTAITRAACSPTESCTCGALSSEACVPQAKSPHPLLRLRPAAATHIDGRLQVPSMDCRQQLRHGEGKLHKTEGALFKPTYGIALALTLCALRRRTTGIPNTTRLAAKRDTCPGTDRLPTTLTPQIVSGSICVYM